MRRVFGGRCLDHPLWLPRKSALPAQLTRRVRSWALGPVGAAMREGQNKGNAVGLSSKNLEELPS